MNICEQIINSEMRKKIINDVLPEAMRFTASVFPFLSEWDVDKLDRIAIEDTVIGSEVQTLFTIEYDPELHSCTLKGSFYALSADIESSLYSCDAIENMVPICNDNLLHAMRKALSENQYQDYEISYGETDEYDDELLKRTKWTAKLTISLENDLYTSFMHAYDKTLCAIELMYEAYETYANKTGLSKFYMEYMGLSDNDGKVFDIEMTAPVYTRGKLMCVYDSHLVDGFNSFRRTYRSIGPNITSTEISVEMVKAKNPSVFITSETLLEEGDELDPGSFEYSQSFRLGKSCGDSRSILHGKDIVARVYYVDPDIYMLEPLDIYFKNGNTKYLIVTRETDGVFHFFTDAKDEIAILKEKEGNYHAAIEYSLKELAPFIVAVEFFFFVPNREQAYSDKYEEDRSFRRMTEQINKAKTKMGTLFKGEDFMNLFYDPATNLFAYLKHENPCEENLDGKTMTYDEIFFVQDTKDRSFGINHGDDTDMYDNSDYKCKQLRLSDL